jgi:hypothetical protein
MTILLRCRRIGANIWRFPAPVEMKKGASWRNAGQLAFLCRRS